MKKTQVTQTSNSMADAMALAIGNKVQDGQEKQIDQKEPEKKTPEKKAASQSTDEPEVSSFMQTAKEMLARGKKKDGDEGDDKTKKPDAEKTPEEKKGVADDLLEPVQDEPDDERFGPKIKAKFGVFKEREAKIQGALKESMSKAEALEAKVKELEAKQAEQKPIEIDTHPEVIELRKRLSEYEGKIEVLDIERSPKFIEKFDNVLNTISEKKLKPLLSAIRDEDDRKSVSLALGAALSIQPGDEFEGDFIAALDKAFEDTSLSDTMKSKISSAMFAWREKYGERGEALANWKETKGKLDSESTQSSVASAVDAVSVFDRAIAEHEVEHGAMLAQFRSNEAVVKYDTLTKPAMEGVRRSLEATIKSGKVHPELIHYLRNGASTPFLVHQSELLANALIAAQKEIANLKGKLKLDDDIDPMVDGDGGGKKGEKKEKGSGYGILDTLKELEASGRR